MLEVNAIQKVTQNMVFGNNAVKPAPRIRTVQQCLQYIKSLDSESCITEYWIRQLCKTNQIKYFASGNKSYINMDYLLNFLGFIEN